MARKTTSTAAPVPVLLADLKASNPDAFDFSNVAPPPEPPKPKTLKEMLGDFTLIAKDAETGVKIYARPPKIAKLERIWEITKSFGDRLEAAQNKTMALIDNMTDLCACVLFVRDGELFREATRAEIKSALDLAQMNEIAFEYAGLKKASGGSDPNA